MSRYLRRIEGGQLRMKREALALLPRAKCALHTAAPATALIMSMGNFKFACSDCALYAEHHGYEVERPQADA